jgi:hypothetical protein
MIAAAHTHSSSTLHIHPSIHSQNTAVPCSPTAPLMPCYALLCPCAQQACRVLRWQVGSQPTSSSRSSSSSSGTHCKPAAAKLGTEGHLSHRCPAPPLSPPPLSLLSLLLPNHLHNTNSGNCGECPTAPSCTCHPGPGFLSNTTHQPNTHVLEHLPHHARTTAAPLPTSSVAPSQTPVKQRRHTQSTTLHTRPAHSTAWTAQPSPAFGQPRWSTQSNTSRFDLRVSTRAACSGCQWAWGPCAQQQLPPVDIPQLGSTPPPPPGGQPSQTCGSAPGQGAAAVGGHGPRGQQQPKEHQHGCHNAGALEGGVGPQVEQQRLLLPDTGLCILSIMRRAGRGGEGRGGEGRGGEGRGGEGQQSVKSSGWRWLMSAPLQPPSGHTATLTPVLLTLETLGQPTCVCAAIAAAVNLRTFPPPAGPCPYPCSPASAL